MRGPLKSTLQCRDIELKQALRNRPRAPILSSVEKVERSKINPCLPLQLTLPVRTILASLMS